MNLLGKVRSQATALAERAQEGAKAGQGKLSTMQARRHADALLAELGALTYLAHAGRSVPLAQERIGRLYSELAVYEALHGPLSAPLHPALADGTDMHIVGEEEGPRA